MQGRYLRLLSSTAFDDSSSAASFLFQPLPRTKSNPQISLIANESIIKIGWVLLLVPCRFCGSFGHWWRECPVRLARTFSVENAIQRCRSKSQHAHYTLIRRRSSLATCLQVFQNYWLPTKELSISTAYQLWYTYIYLKTSGHFWKISLSTIPLKLFITEQNLYERGTAAAVVKGRLRAHYFGWILEHLLRW